MSGNATTGDAASHLDLSRSAFVVSITPFDDDGEVDEPALRAHLHRIRDAGIGVYVGGGGSGEGYTLSWAEHERVLADRGRYAAAGGASARPMASNRVLLRR